MSGGEYWDDKEGEDGGPDGRAGTQTVTRTKKPSLYRVLLLNDDYTPMEFVVYVLERFFQKNQEEATTIMLHVHQNGVGSVRRVHVRGGRDEGRPGFGSRAAARTPAAMHDGKGLTSNGDILTHA